MFVLILDDSVSNEIVEVGEKQVCGRKPIFILAMLGLKCLWQPQEEAFKIRADYSEEMSGAEIVWEFSAEGNGGGGLRACVGSEEGLRGSQCPGTPSVSCWRREEEPPTKMEGQQTVKPKKIRRIRCPEKASGKVSRISSPKYLTEIWREGWPMGLATSLRLRGWGCLPQNTAKEITVTHLEYPKLNISLF